jgi:SAM-dependent methyltransferase
VKEDRAMSTAEQPPLYAPSVAERARQEFVLGVKLLANGPMQGRVRREYAARIAPALTARLGREPARREEVEAPLARSSVFREWATFTHASQSMMWAAIEPTARRGALRADAEFASQRSGPAPVALGSLELDPELKVPEPIAGVEIHRQPGGYIADGPPPSDPASATGDATLAGMRYFGSGLIYSQGKGIVTTGPDGRGSVIVDNVRRHFPTLAPRRILDLGCGIGTASQAVARAYPEAEFHGVEVGAGLLRVAHLLAERRGMPMHFHQRDAGDTRFPDAHFDLIVSHILFHETTESHLPAVLRECRRVLRPGGAMLHVDVGTQVTRLGLPDQVMNDWQVIWNGEPFWTRFAQLDMRQAIIEAGFPAATAFAEHVARGGGGAYYVFGASL